MSREDIPKNISKNITELRKSSGMTQASLAEKLGYSDKSISKWERGEGMPDIICLKNMADLFGVTVDYFLVSSHGETAKAESAETNVAEKKERYVVSRGAIVGVAAAGVILASSVVYVILKLCGIDTLMPFVVSCPVLTLLSVVFNSVWGSAKYSFPTITLFVWSVLFLLSYILRGYSMWLLMLLGIPATLVVWLSCRVKRRVKESDEEEER